MSDTTDVSDRTIFLYRYSVSIFCFCCKKILYLAVLLVSFFALILSECLSLCFALNDCKKKENGITDHTKIDRCLKKQNLFELSKTLFLMISKIRY